MVSWSVPVASMLASAERAFKLQQAPTQTLAVEASGSDYLSQFVNLLWQSDRSSGYQHVWPLTNGLSISNTYVLPWRVYSEGPKKMYVGGSVTPLTIDPDMMSYFDLRAVVKELECPDVSELYQKGPNQSMDDGLVGVTCDKTMLAMFEMHKDSDVIDIYIHKPMMEHNKPSGEEVSTLTIVGPSVQTDDLIDLHDFDDIVDLDDIVNLDECIIPTGPLEGDDDSDKDWEIGDDTDDESDGDSDDGTGDDTDEFSGFADSSGDEDEEEEVEQGVAIMTVNEEGECSDKSDDDLGCLTIRPSTMENRRPSLEVVCNQPVSQKVVEEGLLAEEGEEELVEEGAEELVEKGVEVLLQVEVWQLVKERQLTNHNRTRLPRD